MGEFAQSLVTGTIRVESRRLLLPKKGDIAEAIFILLFGRKTLYLPSE